MAYIGTPPVDRFVATKAASVYSGDGSETIFTLDHSVGSDEDILVSVDGVIQEPSVAYAVSSGTTLTFTAAPSSNSGNNIFVYYLFRTVGTVGHPSSQALSATNGTFTGDVTISNNLTVSGDLASSTSGTSNFRAGVNAGNSIESGGNYNTVVGDEAGTALTTGDNNIAIGFEALKTEDTGQNNVAIGYRAMKVANYDGSGSNVAVGADAGLSMTTGIYNTFVGAFAGDAHTQGYNNVAIGTNALGSDVSSRATVAIGSGALAIQNTTDTDAYNTAVGFSAGAKVTTGIKNVIMGSLAGDEITDGQQNVCIGYNNAYNLTTGDFNVCLGSLARPSSANGEFANVIGYNIEGANNYTTIGKTSSDIRALHGSTTWSTVSDERYKKDIVDSTAGLGFINDLRPRTFKYKNLGDLPDTFNSYEEGSTEVFKNTNTNHGFIAQEVKTAIDAHSEIKDGFRLWDDRDDGSQEVAEAALIPILTKAVQELSAQVTALETENQTQATQIADLISRVTALENG